MNFYVLLFSFGSLVKLAAIMPSQNNMVEMIFPVDVRRTRSTPNTQLASIA